MTGFSHPTKYGQIHQMQKALLKILWNTLSETSDLLETSWIQRRLVHLFVLLTGQHTLQLTKHSQQLVRWRHIITNCLSGNGNFNDTLVAFNFQYFQKKRPYAVVLI